MPEPCADAGSFSYERGNANMLELKNIHWALPDGGEILKGINLTVPDGRLTVVTGPNGGGKTSLAKVIAGLYAPSEGQILLDGEDVTGWDITERARGGIAYAFQQPVRFKGLTVRDLLELSAERTLKYGEICEYLGQVGLCAQEYVDREVNASRSRAARASASSWPPCWRAKTRVCCRVRRAGGGHRSVELLQSDCRL